MMFTEIGRLTKGLISAFRRSRAASPSRRATARLRLEQLESRWVPSGFHNATSGNWSGYAVNSSAGSVTAVSGEFIVPTVTGTATAYSSAWVGIDGSNSNSVEQTGIEADASKNGVAHYSAWYEMYPAGSVTVPLAIHAGDTISASVVYSQATGLFTLTITDLSDPAGSNSFTISKSAPGAQRSSAEWIEEAPSSNQGVLPLANFGTETFSNASATINGTTGAINNAVWASEAEAINMVSRSGALEAGTSTLNAAGTGFTVTYGATGAPPSNPTPPTPPTPPPPAPKSSVTLTASAPQPYRRGESLATLTVTISGASAGGVVDLWYNGTLLAKANVTIVNGVATATFLVEFPSSGSFTLSASYLGAASNSVTI